MGGRWDGTSSGRGHGRGTGAGRWQPWPRAQPWQRRRPWPRRPDGFMSFLSIAVPVTTTTALPTPSPLPLLHPATSCSTLPGGWGWRTRRWARGPHSTMVFPSSNAKNGGYKSKREFPAWLPVPRCGVFCPKRQRHQPRWPIALRVPYPSADSLSQATLCKGRYCTARCGEGEKT